MKQIRQRKDTKDPKRKSLHRWANPQQNGNASAKRASSNGAIQQSATMHFTRCVIKHPLKNCAESRGHVFAKSLDGEGGFFTHEAKNGRVRHECVFCSMTGDVRDGDTDRFERSNDGVVVTDVINSDTVRSEAEIRNISVSHFKVGQENES
jgi:hypothetical protein